MRSWHLSGDKTHPHTEGEGKRKSDDEGVHILQFPYPGGGGEIRYQVLPAEEYLTDPKGSRFLVMEKDHPKQAHAEPPYHAHDPPCLGNPLPIESQEIQR